ncbi:hypothetical protein ZYGR_0P02980 [Zygosaccharomyces rouxii]|uniref:Lon protease homolog 2, peroxisomal n=2 Tax=Zygosaccharomyces rouxii TaxID=4956 RepID=C5E4N2_ZYGRC|nr:uncharacterized protein ZYRO0E07458g [Zygosaccharomyces rouxii]KAH9198151.1 hypothetical protein LQ764DRAFT_148720 [Zygosaccharomyces rouxii]GAV49652.1 hypothetical protein ZYGR_0P02980 [Zygosaccharomyces rouxii]CAR30993.1 ZYRO0E07458p [Zygosaccharomyces rouxii]
MFFGKNDNVTDIQDFPCLTLNNAPRVVPIPGILYRLTYELEVGQNILGNFKNLKSYENHLLLTGVKGRDKDQPSDSKIANSLTKFRTNHDSPNEEKSLYLTLIPSEYGDPCVGCVAKVVGVLTEQKTMTISFKTQKRAIVKAPLVNSGNQVFNSTIKVVDDFPGISKLTREQLKRGPQEFKELFNSIDETIRSFKSQYKQPAKNKKSSQHLLFLSPLSNTLFFQLNKTGFNKAWSIILGLVVDLENNVKKRSDPEIYLEVLKLVDLITAVLPISVHQKWTILTTTNFTERFQNFGNVLQNFQNVFETLYASTGYVQQYFTQASNLDKSRLIANQLKSLKFFIDDVKAQNTFPADVEKRHNKPKTLVPRNFHFDKGSNSKEGKVDEDEEDEEDIDLLKKFIDNIRQYEIHPDGIKMLKKDFKRFAKMSPQNTEYQVLKNYFDIITDIPFGRYGEREPIDVNKSRNTLDKDHYGLQMVKKRLLEYLCILKLQEKLGNIKKRAPILLLVGPPGVGKTSIAKSVAQVLNRQFQRVSLGGIHNEADIRGHRRTYVGSMCGLIINALRKSDCMNPLILLDEVDKVLSTTGSSAGYSSKINGDPGAALLEVLDPEQNNTFMDHYLGFPVDLSQVLFFCTANDLSGISRPLLDRMEVIEIPGYTPEEKIQIGTNFLLPKQISLNGLDSCNCEFQISDKAWKSLVLEYTREPGVRSLERQLAAIVRGKVSEVVETGKYEEKNSTSRSENEVLQPKELLKYLGFPLHPITRELLQQIKHAEKEGVVNGLSYNSDGTGSVLVFEVIKTGGSDGQDISNTKNGPTIISTGNLGNVLQESINIAKSVVKVMLRKKQLVFPPQVVINLQEFLSSEYHLHVPAGAISKDGPSAGAAIALALLSVALKKPVEPTICMTGELTLRGKILPIGGIKEKLLGARIYGMHKVLVPLANRSDLVEALTDDVAPFANGQDRSELDLVKQKMHLQVCYVDTIHDVVRHAWPDFSDASSPSSNTWTLPDNNSHRAKL